MESGTLSVEELLAAALRGDARPWPSAGNQADLITAAVDAVNYHGIAGLLVERRAALRTWPDRLIETITNQARAQAMWEMRHRQLLSALLAALDEEGIRSLLMKGTAVAYDLYNEPATRARADTDLLIDAKDLPRTKAVLSKLGYVAGILGGVDVEFALQRPWTLTLADGDCHSIDLHWQVMNAPSLKGLLTFAECVAHTRRLPRLSPHARTMDRVRLLVHTCLHRAMHCNTPYFANGAAYFDSRRLIWTYDIHLLTEALDEEQWSLLCALAREKGVSRVCLEGLQEARVSLASAIPREVMDELEASMAKDQNSSYFVRSRGLTRAWHDIRAMPGLSSKLRYARARILPDPNFVRAKYPRMAGYALPLLYARRLFELVASRSGSQPR